MCRVCHSCAAAEPRVTLVWDEPVVLWDGSTLAEGRPRRILIPMKWIATLANFFFPGLGYIIAVPEKRTLGILWLLGALGLTYVEQFAINRETNFTAFAAMFASVFIMNTAFAIDAYRSVEAPSPQPALA